MPMKNSLTPAGIEPATFPFVAQDDGVTVIPKHVGVALNVNFNIVFF